MSEHRMKLEWKRETDDFSVRTYNRSHLWDFGHENIIDASAAPEYLGNAEMVDPERAFVASVASCHMLTFIYHACNEGFVVDRYEDEPVGILGKNGDGRISMTSVTLYPKITFGGDKTPDKETLDRLHDSAHRDCFISNSVKSKVSINCISQS